MSIQYNCLLLFLLPSLLCLVAFISFWMTWNAPFIFFFFNFGSIKLQAVVHSPTHVCVCVCVCALRGCKWNLYLQLRRGTVYGRRRRWGLRLASPPSTAAKRASKFQRAVRMYQLDAISNVGAWVWELGSLRLHFFPFSFSFFLRTTHTHTAVLCCAALRVCVQRLKIADDVYRGSKRSYGGRGFYSKDLSVHVLFSFFLFFCAQQQHDDEAMNNQQPPLSYPLPCRW